MSTKLRGKVRRFEMDDSRLYNKSIREAYENMVKGTTNRGKSGTWASSSSLKADGLVDLNEENNSEFSDRENEIQDVDLNSGDKNDNNDYEQFKKSLIQDDEWLHDWEDDDDTEYTEEADQSFLVEDDDSDFDEDEYSYRKLRRSRDNSGDLGDDGSSWLTSRTIWAISLVIIAVWLTGSFLTVHGSSPLTPDLNRRINSLQNQLNQLTHERETQKKKYEYDIDQNIKVIIQQFERNVKKLLPKNIKDLSGIDTSVKKLEMKVNTLTEKVAWKNINDTLSRLNEVLPSEIPVIISSDPSAGTNGTNKSMLLIPELHQYLAELIPSLLNDSKVIESLVSKSNFKYDLNHYVKEILNNEFQFIEKSQFIQELHSHMQEIKDEFNKEIELRTNQVQTPQQISKIVLKRMIHNIYNTNQHQWENNLNKATFAQGAKLLNHLCSKTVKGSTGPVDLLQDCSLGCSTSTYWQCERKECKWAIRFDEPFFLSKISYLHGRFAYNLDIMSAAPKIISIYVKPINSLSKLSQITHWSEDYSYIKLGQLHYDIFSKPIKQDFQLPDWFIQSKSMVRSIVFVIEENHGNPNFTALRKFVVNGVSPADLQLMNSFPSDWNRFVPEYSISVEEQERSRLSKMAQWQDQKVPSFGEDEPVN